jgi:hypothetical protein
VTLFNAFESFNKLIGQNSLTKRVNALNRLRIKIPKKPLVTSRVSFTAEAGGKSRLFAMVDYFTQCSLQGTHKDLMQMLKRVNMVDATFDQDAAVKALCSRMQDYASSMDLTGATDRFPAILQRLVLNRIYHTPDESFEGKFIGSL